MKSTLDSEIRARIDAFATELAQLVQQTALASVQSALGIVSSAAQGGAGRRRGRGKGNGRRKGAGRRRRSKRAPDAALVGKVLAHVKANKGTGVAEIGKALGASSNAIKPAIAVLLADKKVRKSGQRRGTKYHGRGK